MARVASLCSGVEAPIQALENLSVPHVHLLSCDNDPHVKATLLANFRPQAYIDNIDAVLQAPVPANSVDLAVAGAPCQRFSGLGLNQGISESRGYVMLHVLRFIQHTMPKIVLLENVRGLVSRHRPTFDAIIMMLEEMTYGSLQYHVEWAILDTKHFLIPQSRSRVFIVAVRNDVHKHPLQWPKPHPEPCRCIDVLLPPRPPRQSLCKQWPGHITGRNNLLRMLALLHEGNHDDPFSKTYVLDIGSSSGWAGQPCRGLSPCLTASRCQIGGHLLSTHGD